MDTSLPPAGYYPDPAGSSGLRWWDGRQWTATVAEVPTRPPVSLSHASTTVLPEAPSTSAAPAARTGSSTRNWLITAVAVVAFVAVGFATVVVASHRTSPTSSAVSSRPVTVKAHTRAQEPKATPHRGKPVVNMFVALHVVDEFWRKHERAYGANDVAALRRLDGGALEFYDVGIATCHCQHQHPRSMLEARYFVPWQTTYPAYFASQVRSRVGAQSQADIYVFEKRSARSPWVAIEDSGFAAPLGQITGLGTPDNEANGYDKRPPPSAHARALHVAQRFAALWTHIKQTGHVPPSNGFVMTEALRSRLYDIAEHRQDQRQANGLMGHYRFYVSSKDPLVEFSDAGRDLACQPIREIVTYRAPPGRTIVQPRSQRTWGTLLPPGRYQTIVSRDAWQTCFVIPPDPRQPIMVFDQATGGGQRTAH